MDAYRSVAVQMGAAADLKNVISKSGMKTNFLAAPGTGPGEPNDEMYLKQAEHLMKRSIYPAAVAYLDQAIHLNPHSKVRSLLLSFLRLTKIPFLCLADRSVDQSQVPPHDGQVGGGVAGGGQRIKKVMK